MRRFIAAGVLSFLLGCASSSEQHETRKPRVPKPGTKPVHVTTRSGSLRQPGLEQPAAFDEAPTPTFAPEDAPPRQARRFSSEIPQGNRAPLRSSSLGQSGSQNPADKPTMIDWLKGFGSKKKTETSARTSADNAAPSSSELGTSIDPRRVYRGPKPEEEIDESRYGSSFSETGIPETGTEFRGREDSAF